MGVKRQDPIGEIFNNVKVLEFLYSTRAGSYYKCECLLCGRIFTTRKSSLVNGHTKSCGCSRDTWMHSGNLNKRHGYSNDRVYWVWTKIKARCYNPNCREYKNYGGRGIKMCKEWLDPKNFVEWAYASGYNKDAPKGQCTLDRIDVDGEYSPTNCRWITNLEQQNNRRDCRFVEYQGEKHTIAEWARKLQIPETSLRGAITHRGLSMEEFLNQYTPYK